MFKLDSFLKELIAKGGSDLHVCAGAVPVIRLHGELMNMGNYVISPEESEKMLTEILSEEQLEYLKQEKNIDLAYEIKHGGIVQRFRSNIYYQRKGLDGVFHAIPNKIPTLKSLGLPDTLAKLTRFNQGLVLMTGPAGSGKTTTLASLIDIINEERTCHIITIEDPIEYIYVNKRSLINQRQVGKHTKSFHSALRSALREDPDVILVGELRDLETIQLAITASETGHLVFGTLHTNSAAKTIDRIIDVFPPNQQAQIKTMVSESLRGVISQILLPKADGWGRMPAVEILVGCMPVANFIREGKTYQIPSVMQTGKSMGMLLMDDSLAELLNGGKIKAQEAYDRATDKKRFEEYLIQR